MTDRKEGKRHRRPRSETDPEQWERFLEAAREHGCEENAGRVDEVVRRAAKMPPPRKERPRPKKERKADS